MITLPEACAPPRPMDSSSSFKLMPRDAATLAMAAATVRSCIAALGSPPAGAPPFERPNRLATVARSIQQGGEARGDGVDCDGDEMGAGYCIEQEGV